MDIYLSIYISSMMFVCLCIAKDLTNHRADMVPLYSEVSYRSQKGFKLLWTPRAAFSYMMSACLYV